MIWMDRMAMVGLERVGDVQACVWGGQRYVCVLVSPQASGAD